MKSISKISLNNLMFCLLLFGFVTNAQVGIGTVNPKSTFEVNGSCGQKVNTIAANTTLDDTYGIVVCNNVSAVTVTLPDVTKCTGRVYTIKRSASSSENVTIAGTIDGASNLVLAKAGEAVILFSTGLEWKVASTNNSSSSSEVWDDLLVHPDATTKGGSKAPAWGGKSANAFKNNSGSQGVFLWMFSATQEQVVYFTVQMPHAYKVGSDLFPHVHWTSATGTPSGSNVVWGLEYTVVVIGGNFPSTTTLTSNSVVATPSGIGQHNITPLGKINGAGIEISTILVCRLYRAPDDSRDTFGDEVGLLSMDFHYQIDALGSRTEYTK